MLAVLNEIRKPESIALHKKIFFSFIVLIAGVLLGIISKILDETASNSLLTIIGILDLRNFFSRIGIWLFLAVLISTFSKTPLRAAMNVFLFFTGMVGSYYLYTILIAGFFPRVYMMIWIALTFISPIMAIVCWYAKGKGIMPVIISSIILMIITRQAFAFGFWYLDVRNILELILWFLTFFILYISPKQIIKVSIIGILMFFLTSHLHFLGGIL
jgi:hypothetical protein